MSLDVVINIYSVIEYADGQTEKVTQSFAGKLYAKENDFFLRYKEQSDLGDIWTTIKWSNSNPIDVTIIRQGNVRTSQKFKEGLTYQSLYQNSLISFPLTTRTRKLELNHKNESGLIYVDYDISNDGKLLGKYNIKIEYH